MSDIADFLAARIYEDEEAAREATKGPWRTWKDNTENPWRAGVETSWAHDGDVEEDTELITDWCSLSDAEHIARHNPTRALAECKAKQGILLSYMTRRRQATELNRYYADNPAIYYQMPSDLELKYLALPYADHPDYQPSWAPPEPGTVETWGRR